ncbi:hypothetical protein BDW71DRAFT_216258 [Aspergillus fruticulosus]
MALRGSGGSCLNCRTRKVRCDRTLPQCSQCKQGSLECLVPEAPPRLLWLPIRTQGNFSLDQEQIELDMHSGGDLCASIGAVLEQLDYLAEGVANGMSTSNGRFHAFRYDRTTDILTSPWSTELCISHELLVVSEHPEEADPLFQPSQQEWTLQMSTAKLLLDHYQNITTTLYAPASAEATKRLQMALRHLSTGLPKKEKYKNILMPLLSMVTICVRTNLKTHFGSQTNTTASDC